MISAFDLLDLISARKGGVALIKGLYVIALEDVPNDYGADFKIVPRGTVVRCDFGGDFGFYGFADLDGAIRRT